jgi:hypothetical protein
VITTMTTFRLRKPITREQARELFLGTAPRYRSVEGLLRKSYILSEDGSTAGGIYLWRTRRDAEAMYTPSWRAFVTEKYGCEPQVTYFETPVVVDNVAGRIVSEPE